MRSLLVYLWIAVAVFSCGSNDVLANKDRKELYAAAFTKMAEEFAAVNDLTDPIEIRRRHAALIKEYGNFSLNPCQNFLAFAAEGYLSTVPGANPNLLGMREYDSEVFKYLSREVLKAGKYEFSCSAERKATKFYSSCMEYEPSSEDLQAVARKLFEIVESSPKLSVAFLGLRTYGIDIFWSFSIVRSLYMDKPAEFLSSETLEELKDTVNTILQINNEADGNVDEIAQRVWEFNEELKKCVSPGTSGTFDYFSIQQAYERYPALVEVLIPVHDSKVDFDLRTNDIAYIENLNKLLEKTDQTTIKEYMTVRVYEYLRKTQNSFRNVANTCSDATFEFFEPALKSLFIGTYITPADAANVVAVFEAHIEFLRAQFKALGASPKKLEEFEAKFGNIEYIIDPIYTDIQYLDSLYADVSYESGKGFLEEYFNTVYNHNEMRTKCSQSIDPKVLELRVDENYPDTWKPHQICRTGVRPFSLPLRYLTVPFYNSAYPKYWTHGSLVFFHFYNYLLVRDDTSDDLMGLFDEFHNTDVNIAEEYPGYEDLNFTSAQLYQVARMQGASLQGDGYHLLHFGRSDPNILKDFKCEL